MQHLQLAEMKINMQDVKKDTVDISQIAQFHQYMHSEQLR